jgi:hypothetical protein
LGKCLKNQLKKMKCEICNAPLPNPVGTPDNPFIGVAWGDIEAGDYVEFGKCEACGTTVLRVKREAIPMKMKMIFFSNGNSAMFDDSGIQMPEYSKSWLQLMFSFLANVGVEPSDVEFTMPNGTTARAIWIEPNEWAPQGRWTWEIK